MFISPPCERWHALQVRPKHERKVAASLREIGQQEFLPLLYDDRSTRGGEGPLFPGYVFCKIDWLNGPRLYRIAGIIRVVGAGKTPVPIDDGEIDAIRRVVESCVEYQPCPFRKQGTPVQIARGPLAGITGTIMEPRSRQIVLSVSLMCRSVAVTIDPDLLTWLEPLSTAGASGAA